MITDRPAEHLGTLCRDEVFTLLEGEIAKSGKQGDCID
jgi:hypothetical protein